MFKALIFDFDGTLADTWELMIIAIGLIAEREGFVPPDRGRLKEMKELSIKDRFKDMGMPVYKLPGVIRDIKKTFLEHRDSLRPFPGIGDVLLQLAERGFDLHILSTNNRKVIDSFLQAHHMEMFKSVNTSPGLFGKHRTMSKLLQKEGLSRDEVLYVGDELRDIEACRAAGIKVLSVSWGYDAPSLLEKGKPQYLAHKPEDILEILS